jgi:hypothetical protein
MPGKRGPEFGDFVTDFDEYRMNVVAADTADIDDPSIPILDTRPGPNRNVVGQGSDNNQYGRNAQIGLGILLDSGISSAKFKLWVLVEPTRAVLTQAGASGSSSSSSSSAGPVSWWAVAKSEFTVAESSYVVIKDIPPGQYKLEVTELNGSGTLSVVESHAA